MLRILQPGLLCFAPLVLASPAIGTRALKARRRAAQGGRSERREDLEPWEEAGVYESPEGVKQAAAPLQHQAHLWCSQYEGNSRERRSSAGFLRPRRPRSQEREPRAPDAAHLWCLRRRQSGKCGTIAHACIQARTACLTWSGRDSEKRRLRTPRDKALASAVSGDGFLVPGKDFT